MMPLRSRNLSEPHSNESRGYAQADPLGHSIFCFVGFKGYLRETSQRVLKGLPGAQGAQDS